MLVDSWTVVWAAKSIAVYAKRGENTVVDWSKSMLLAVGVLGY